MEFYYKYYLSVITFFAPDHNPQDSNPIIKPFKADAIENSFIPRETKATPITRAKIGRYLFGRPILLTISTIPTVIPANIPNVIGIVILYF